MPGEAESADPGAVGGALEDGADSSEPSCPELKTATKKSVQIEPEWDGWRRSVYLALRQQSAWGQAERFLCCGNECKLSCANCGEERVGARYCMSRACPECMQRQGRVIARKLLRKIKSQGQRKKGYGTKLLALTVGTEGLSNAEKLEILKRSLPKLFDRVFWRNAQGQTRKDAKRSQGAMTCVTGMYRAIEFGPKTGNPHAHCILYVPYVPQAYIRAVWEQLVQRGNAYIEATRSLKAAIREGVKYMSDVRKLAGERVVEMLELLSGTRRVQGYGIFFGIDAEKECADPPVPCPKCGGTAWLTEEGLEWLVRRAVKRQPEKGGPTHGPPHTRKVHPDGASVLGLLF